MANFLSITENPQYNSLELFKVMRDFRKGGLNPDNFEEFINLINELPPISQRKSEDYKIFDRLNLNDISSSDLSVIVQESLRRSTEESKKCWHPDASLENCSTNKTGKIQITAAHSIQNNGILNRIAEKGHVKTYKYSNGKFNENSIGKNLASIFYGFCNKHDSIFKPIETESYTRTPEQNFLFAYRGFIVAIHKKVEASRIMNYGDKPKKDIEENLSIFNKAIKSRSYNDINSYIIELPAFYPIAVSSAFYLDFDFEGNKINHSDDRMEFIFITLFPEENKSYFIISYFEKDKNLYENLGNQLEERNNIKSDITMLIASHVENIYFNPTYYDTFIKEHENKFETILMQSQVDIAKLNKDDEIPEALSLTPSNYLNNKFKINYFGY